LFKSQQEAHAFMMETVRECANDALKDGYYPSEALFVESVKSLWMELVSRYAPPEPKAAA
jgi:hypothetical protein